MLEIKVASPVIKKIYSNVEFQWCLNYFGDVLLKESKSIGENVYLLTSQGSNVDGRGQQSGKYRKADPPDPNVKLDTPENS
jgi:hypothetical protein